MTQITKHSSVKGSLQSQANKLNITVAQAFLNAEIVVLMDCSASMSYQDYIYDSETRYKKACNQLARLQSENPGKVCLISFSSGQEFSPSGIAKWPNGSTDIAGALQFIKPVDGLDCKLILISDGEPDDDAEAIKTAQDFKSKIHCIYIGPENGSGADFLKRLSAVTGGQFSNNGVAGIGNLSNTVAGYLAA
jgi:uncharacterized protein with von Willebrand factor type A (vWA) domain